MAAHGFSNSSSQVWVDWEVSNWITKKSSRKIFGTRFSERHKNKNTNLKWYFSEAYQHTSFYPLPYSKNKYNKEKNIIQVCFWFCLIDATLWFLTRNACIIQFCQKIQFQRKGDFRWFRTGSLGIRGTFWTWPGPWLGGRAWLQRSWNRWTRLLSKLRPVNEALDEGYK